MAATPADPGAHVEITALDVAANRSAAVVALVGVTARMVSARNDGAVVSARSSPRASTPVGPPVGSVSRAVVVARSGRTRARPLRKRCCRGIRHVRDVGNVAPPGLRGNHRPPVNRALVMAVTLANVACAQLASNTSADAGADAPPEAVDLPAAADVSAAVDVPVCSGDARDGACLPVVAVAAGDGHTCALLGDRTVRCWGYNWAGQVVVGSELHVRRPSPLTGLDDVRAIAARGDLSCAVRGDGSVWCWGYQLTGRSTASRFPRVPTRVDGVAGAVGVACGVSCSCALAADGAVHCWGVNPSGQCGDRVPSDESVRVWPALAGAVGLSAAQHLTCAALGTGSVVCGGGSLRSDGVLDDREARLRTITGIDNAVEVGLGSSYACVRRADGTVWCWGANQVGQLGDGTRAHRTAPVQVRGVDGALALAVGGITACAIVRDRTVRCWGYNGEGTRGDGSTDTPAEATTVVGLAEVVAISAGSVHVCAVRADGSLWCWGNGVLGQLGDGERVSRTSPVEVRW
jgi:alpha-tubulin suppressor-like RCC1 family protein